MDQQNTSRKQAEVTTVWHYINSIIIIIITVSSSTGDFGFWHTDELIEALHVLRLQLSPPPPSSLAPIKSRMETFWYQLKWVHVENGR